jgi:ABC-type dipeptide/oligopeptide/nickel transport system permease component
VFGIVVVVANLLADMVYAILDPRVRYGRTAA